MSHVDGFISLVWPNRITASFTVFVFGLSTDELLKWLNLHVRVKKTDTTLSRVHSQHLTHSFLLRLPTAGGL